MQEHFLFKWFTLDFVRIESVTDPACLDYVCMIICPSFYCCNQLFQELCLRIILLPRFPFEEVFVQKVSLVLFSYNTNRFNSLYLVTTSLIFNTVYFVRIVAESFLSVEQNCRHVARLTAINREFIPNYLATFTNYSIAWLVLLPELFWRIGSIHCET